MAHTRELYASRFDTLSTVLRFFGSCCCVNCRPPAPSDWEIEREKQFFLRRETWILNHQRTIGVNRTFYSRRTAKWKWNVNQMEVKCEKFSQIDLSSFRCKFQSVEKKIAFRRYVGDQQRYQNHTITVLWKLELYLPRRQWEKLSEISIFSNFHVLLLSQHLAKNVTLFFHHSHLLAFASLHLRGLRSWKNIPIITPSLPINTARRFDFNIASSPFTLSDDFIDICLLFFHHHHRILWEIELSNVRSSARVGGGGRSGRKKRKNQNTTNRPSGQLIESQWVGKKRKNSAEKIFIILSSIPSTLISREYLRPALRS